MIKKMLFVSLIQNFKAGDETLSTGKLVSVQQM